MVCDIPPWVVDCIAGCIDAFNAEHPPLYGDTMAAGAGHSMAPPEVVEQLARQSLFIGRDGGTSVLSYAAGLCSRNTVAQLQAIATAYGGAGDFEGYIGEATGIDVTVSYLHDRGFLGDELRSTEVRVLGVNTALVPTHYNAVSCGTEPGVRPRRIPNRASPSQQFLIDKYTFRPFWPDTGLCNLRSLTPDEEYLLGEAYRHATAAEPVQFAPDAATRLMLDRAWLEAFWSYPDPYLMGLRIRLFGMSEMMDFSRGPGADGSFDGSAPYSPGRVDPDSMRFGVWIRVRQCLWDPAP
ncbi:MAG: hypothetical protein J0L92_33520 [Deltaproteobacteria bacterium]|nr:hypothetical protein [Deltaproteobacteria bacterium]